MITVTEGEELWWHGELGGLVRSANEQARMLEQRVSEWGVGQDQGQSNAHGHGPGHGRQMGQQQAATVVRSRTEREPHNATASTHMSGASSMSRVSINSFDGGTVDGTHSRGRSDGSISGHVGMTPSQGMTPSSLHWTAVSITPSSGSSRMRPALSHTHTHLHSQPTTGTPRGQTVSFSSPIAVISTPTTYGRSSGGGSSDRQRSDSHSSRSHQDIRSRGQSSPSSITDSNSRPNNQPKGVRWEASDESRQLRCGKAEAESRVATGSAAALWMASEKQARDWMHDGE
jgi:hypothetical protein